MEWIDQMDLSLLNFLQEHCRTDFLDAFFSIVTTLGNSGIIWIVLSLILICTKKYRRIGILLLIALLIGSVLGEGILKPLIGRARPFYSNTEIDLLITPPSGYSFPSGHSWSSFTAATILCFANRKIGFAALFLAACIAFSRLYLYVHFPSDVLVGILCGIATGLFAVFCSRKISDWMQKRKSEK